MRIQHTSTWLERAKSTNFMETNLAICVLYSLAKMEHYFRAIIKINWKNWAERAGNITNTISCIMALTGVYGFRIERRIRMGLTRFNRDWSICKVVVFKNIISWRIFNHCTSFGWLEPCTSSCNVVGCWKNNGLMFGW